MSLKLAYLTILVVVIPTAPATNEIREAAGVILMVEHVRKSDLVLSSSGDLPGQYTWKFDQALPG